jgi:hypothetical protein
MGDKKERLLTSQEWTDWHAGTSHPAKLQDANASLAWVALGVCFVIFLVNPLVGAIFSGGAFLWLLSANNSAKKSAKK